MKEALFPRGNRELREKAETLLLVVLEQCGVHNHLLFVDPSASPD